MKPEDCFELGYIARSHGIKGEVRAIFEVNDIRKYQKKEKVWLFKHNRLSPFFIESFHIMSSTEALLAFKGLIDRDEADKLRGYSILLPLSDLPEPPKGKFYFHEVEGFTVEDRNLGILGIVKGVLEMPAQNLVQMEYKGVEVLIPVTKQILPGIDREKKLLFTNLPPGHLDVYLSAPTAEELSEAQEEKDASE